MLTVAVSSTDFEHICYGIAAIMTASAPLVGAWATLVWARRRDTRSSEPVPPIELPKAE